MYLFVISKEELTLSSLLLARLPGNARDTLLQQPETSLSVSRINLSLKDVFLVRRKKMGGLFYVMYFVNFKFVIQK